MDIEWLRGVCLSLAGVTEEILWGNDLVFKVGGKMFAAAGLEPGPVCLSFKCSEEEFAELVERPGIIPAPYLARAHWVAVETESAVRRAEMERLIREAHGLILAKLPKKVRHEILAAKPGVMTGRGARPRKRKR